MILITTSTHILSPSSLGLDSLHRPSPNTNAGLPAISIKAHSLSPSSLGLEKFSSQTQLDIISGLFGRDKDNDETTHSLSPSSLGLEKLSSQTQLEYKRGYATISIKAHSLSPSSLGLKPLDTNPARIQPRDFPRLVYKLILSPLLRWVEETQRTINTPLLRFCEAKRRGDEDKR